MHTLRVAAVLPLLLSAGCATTCHDRDIYRPALVSAGDGTIDLEQTQVTTNLASLSTVRLGECGWAKRNANADPTALCMTIRVEDSHILQLQPPIVRVVSDTGVSHDLPIGKLQYSIFSRYEADGSEEPDSTLKSPTVASLEIQRGQRYGNGRTDLYSFDASAPFQGAESTFGPRMARAISRDERRRQYFASLQLPSDLGKRFVVTLPRASLDGKSYSLPRLEFRYSRESVCTFNP